MVNQKEKEFIVKQLRILEEQHDIAVIFAVESGSRLWGMASVNSDFDIRFVYKRPVEHYLRILNKGSDTIQFMDGDYDYSGWDIDKFLKLIYKSNPGAMEWLQSDIIYMGDKSEFEDYTSFINPVSLYHHYRSLSKKQFERYIDKKEKVIRKKYLYVVRGIINALYVLQFAKIPYPKLIDTMHELDLGDISELIIDLIEKKKQEKEMGKSDRIEILDTYAQSFYESVEDHRDQLQNTEKIDANELNVTFMRIIGFR